MNSDVDRIIISTDQLAGRVCELGEEITDRFRGYDDLVVISVLNGALVFLTDLIRQMPMTIRIGAIGVSSYSGRRQRSEGAEIRTQLEVGVRLNGRCVLIVDDILDSGNTLRLVQDVIQKENPAILETAVLLRKPDRAPTDIPVEYIGFDVPDEFVVGYGLDFDGKYRNLPFVGVLKPECYREAEPAQKGAVR